MASSFCSYPSENIDLSLKVREIERVLSQENVDLWKLRELSLSEGGLVNDSIRKRAWPKLVGLHDLYYNGDDDNDDDDYDNDNDNDEEDEDDEDNDNDEDDEDNDNDEDEEDDDGNEEVEEDEKEMSSDDDNTSNLGLGESTAGAAALVAGGGGGDDFPYGGTSTSSTSRSSPEQQQDAMMTATTPQQQSNLISSSSSLSQQQIIDDDDNSHDGNNEGEGVLPQEPQQSAMMVSTSPPQNEEGDGDHKEAPQDDLLAKYSQLEEEWKQASASSGLALLSSAQMDSQLEEDEEDDDDDEGLLMGEGEPLLSLSQPQPQSPPISQQQEEDQDDNTQPQSAMMTTTSTYSPSPSQLLLVDDEDHTEGRAVLGTTGRPPRPPPPPSKNKENDEDEDDEDDDDDEEEEDDDNSVFSTASLGSSSNMNKRKRSDNGKHIPIVAVCLDFEQIERDVARCTWHLLTGSQRAQRLQMEHLSKSRKNSVARLVRRKQRKLANLINLALVQSYSQSRRSGGNSNSTKNKAISGYNSTTSSSQSEKFRYYQGYHDVACIFLSSLGGTTGIPSHSNISSGNKNVLPAAPASSKAANTANLEVAAAVLLQISGSHLRDCLRPNFANLQTALRLSLMPLLAKLDRDVHAHLQNAEMEPYFCLSWIITWFSHEIRDTELVKRLFDAFLVSHPLMPIYVSVAMMIHPLNRREILECECDFSLLHQTLAGLPKNSSMTGWKYQPGNGYVTDDDEADGTVSTGTGASMEGSNNAAEFLLVERLNSSTAAGDNLMAKYQQETGSLVSSTLSCSLEPPAPVRFQVLIEDAAEIMRRIPPHRLLALARRYYGREEVEKCLEAAPDIEWFREDPPDWAIASTTKADWVLRHRTRKQQRRTKSQLRHRRRNQRNSGDDNDEDDDDERRPLLPDAASGLDQHEISSRESLNTYMKEHSSSIAVIACGLCPGDDDDEIRRKRKRRKLAVAVAVALFAVAVGVAVQYSQQTSSSSTTTSSSANGGMTSPSVIAEAVAARHPPSVLRKGGSGTEENRQAPAQRPVLLPSPLDNANDYDVTNNPTCESTATAETAAADGASSSQEGSSLVSSTTSSSSGRAAGMVKTSSSGINDVWKTPGLLFTPTNIDAAYYASVLSAVQRLTMREARNVHAYLVETYVGIIRPQLHAVMTVMSELYVRTTDCELCRQAIMQIRRRVQHLKLAFDNIQGAVTERVAPRVEKLAAALATDNKKVDLEAVTDNARGARARVWDIELAAYAHLMEKLNYFPATHRLRLAVQKAATSPIAHKVFDAMVGALLDATVAL